MSSPRPRGRRRREGCLLGVGAGGVGLGAVRQGPASRGCGSLALPDESPAWGPKSLPRRHNTPCHLLNTKRSSGTAPTMTEHPPLRRRRHASLGRRLVVLSALRRLSPVEGVLPLGGQSVSVNVKVAPLELPIQCRWTRRTRKYVPTILDGTPQTCHNGETSRGGAYDPRMSSKT